MSRASTKPDLLKSANDQFEKLWKLIGSMTEDERRAVIDFPEAPGKEAHWERDKNIRDVLAHLYEWHRLLLSWVESNMNDVAKPFLPQPYNWKTYGQMNMEFWEKHQSTPYEKANEMLLESHRKVIELIEGFSNDELFEKKHFAWTGTTNIGTYCVSVTSSHYEWAMKKIKLHIKAYRAKESQK